MPATDKGRTVKKKPKIKPPSAIQQAKAQERQYASQGKAVEKQAQRQKKASGRTRPAPKVQPGPSSDKERRKVERHRETPEYQQALRRARVRGPAGPRGTRRPAGDSKADSEFAKGQEYVREQYRRKYLDPKDFKRFYEEGTTQPPLTAAKRRLRQATEDAEERKAAMSAPVLKALEQTTRPLHAVAGVERSLIKSAKKGQLGSTKAVTDAGKAAVKGLKNEDKSTYDDVLGDLGVPKGKVRSVAAFGGDVVGDPLTYVSGGTGSVIRKQALKDAARVEKKALKKGLTQEQAKRMGERAERRAMKKDTGARGVTVRFGGKELPGVRRGTAAVGAKVRKATDKPKIVRKTKNLGRRVGAEVNANVRPDQITREQFRESKRAARSARAGTNADVRRAKSRGAAFRKAVGKADQEIIDAIEAGTWRNLPPDKRRIAKRYIDELKHARRMERRAGINVGDAGRKRKITVPEVAADVDEARKALRAAQATRNKTERQYRRQAIEAGRRQDRAEVLVGRASRRKTKSSDVADNRIGNAHFIANRRKAIADAEANILALKAKLKAEPKALMASTWKGDLARTQKNLAIYRDELKLALGPTTQAAPRSSRKRMRPRATVLAAVRERGKLLDLDRAQTVGQAREAVRAAEQHLEAVKVEARQQRLARRRAEKAQEVARTAPKGYVPHVLADRAEEAAGRGGQKTIRPSFSKGRQEKRTLAAIRETDPSKYIEDAPALLANRLIEGGVARRKAELNRRLADMGQRVKKGMEVNPSKLADKGEGVFHIKGSNVRELDLGNSEHVREIQRFIDGDSSKGGQYVILNSQVANKALRGSKVADRTEIGKIIDKAQGGWKWLATQPNPGFHIRNFAGGVQNAYLYTSGHKLPLNLAQAAKVLSAHSKNAEAARALDGKAATKGTIDTKRYGKVSISEVADRLEKAGAIRGGFVGREIPELLGEAPTKGVKKIRRDAGKVGRLGRGVARAPRNIEDLPRAATAIEALKRGATWEEASEVAAKFHFDYADLTPLERRAFRRLMPFYTFSARNIPLQLKSYFKRPGKFAQYQKIREEVANYFDIDLDEAEGGMEEHEQRAAPVVIKWKGQTFNLSLGPSGLPLTDLNEMPASADPTEWADEWINRGMSLVTPIVKSPVELWANFSFFFRDQIERETGPLVPAPSIVARLPKPLQKELGVVDDYVDRRTGKKGLGWPAKIDYIANQLSPGPLGAAKRVLTPSERKGQDAGTKLLGYFGTRLTPLDPLTKQINDLYEKRAELGKKRAALNQRGMNADNPTPEWAKVNNEYNKLDKEIAALRGKRGDKLIPKRGRPKKIRRPSRPSSSSDGSFFGGSSSSSDSGGSFFGGESKSSPKRGGFFD